MYKIFNFSFLKPSIHDFLKHFNHFYHFKPLLLFSSLCISFSFYNKVCSLLKPSIKKVNPVKSYVDCYKEKLDKLYKDYCCNLVEKSLKENLSFSSYCTIIENTPRGNVIMSYNNDSKCIKYYCDFSITNEILRTVFQKFVLTFKFFPLYYGTFEIIKNDDNDENLDNDDIGYNIDTIERNDTYNNHLKTVDTVSLHVSSNKKETKETKEKESKKDQLLKKHSKVFAKFKNYKDVNKDPDNSSSTNSTTNTMLKNKLKNNEKDKDNVTSFHKHNNSNTLLHNFFNSQNSNNTNNSYQETNNNYLEFCSFKRIGKICDYKLLNRKDKTNKKHSSKNVSFSEFMKLKNT